MAKKFIFVNVDITFPNSMTDDDYAGADLVPPAVSLKEVRKILEAGATEDGFDIEYSTSHKATKSGMQANLLVDLVQQ